MCERRIDLDKWKKWFYPGKHSEKACPFYAADSWCPCTAGSIWCRRPSGSWTLWLHLRIICRFYRKPGTEPCDFCGDTVCYGNHSPHSPLSWRKKAWTDWLCYWRCCSCFCCYFCHTFYCNDCFCPPYFRAYAGSCGGCFTYYKLCKNLWKRYFLHCCL